METPYPDCRPKNFQNKTQTLYSHCLPHKFQNLFNILICIVQKIFVARSRCDKYSVENIREGSKVPPGLLGVEVKPPPLWPVRVKVSPGLQGLRYDKANKKVAFHRKIEGYYMAS